MRFVTISDTHGQHKNLSLPKGDAIIHAGDVSQSGKLNEVLDFMDWFKNLDFKYKIFIAGNHDFFFEKMPKSILDELIPKNVIYLCNNGVEIENIKIWGSPMTPTFFNLAFNSNRGKSIAKYWDLIPLGTDILITHGPVFSKLDETTSGENVGCEDLWKRVRKVKPKIHISGHIHEAYGEVITDTTHYFNASVLDEKYKLKNVAQTFDL